jgi:hypothetical protein
LFKFEPRANIVEDFFSEDDKLTLEENELLEEKFSEEEVKKAIFDSYSEGAPGPDGLSFVFYQSFWDMIKQDLMAMLEEFRRGQLDLYRLNFALITIIPKEKDARTMNKYMPISLLNCSYMIFTKVLTIRIIQMIDRLINSKENAFIRGIYILKSVVTTH